MAKSPRTTFLSLPRELRDQVYDNFIMSAVFCNSIYRMCDGRRFKNLQDICKAIPEYRQEILQRFYAEENGVTFDFESLATARAFITDNVWCPNPFRSTLFGHVDVKDGELPRIKEPVRTDGVDRVFDRDEIMGTLDVLKVSDVQARENLAGEVLFDYGTVYTYQTKAVGWRIFFGSCEAHSITHIYGNLGRLGVMYDSK